nr:Hypothetical protein [synthetic construct]
MQAALDGLTAGRYRIIIRLIQPTGHPIQHSQQVEEDNQSQGQTQLDEISFETDADAEF